MESKYLKIGGYVSFKPAGTRATIHQVKVLEIHEFGFFGQQDHQDSPVRLHTWETLDEFTITPDKPKVHVDRTTGGKGRANAPTGT
jgi:hypothetical protein